MKRKIALFLQTFNEVGTGHLERFLDWNLPLVDYLCVFDDGSTDGTYQRIRGDADVIIQSRYNSFGRELVNRQRLLEASLATIPDVDFFLWLDSDEIIYWSEDELQIELDEMNRQNSDGLRVPLLNLWRSDRTVRLDSGYDSARHVRVWRNNSHLKFSDQLGLHNQMFPLGLDSVIDTDRLIVHYGFSSDDLIINKHLLYKSHGQKGWPLNRLVDESALRTRHISEYGSQIGSRCPTDLLKHSGQESESSRPKRSSTEWQLLARLHNLHVQVDHTEITLITLIYQSTRWLEFIFGELLRLRSSIGSVRSELKIIANHATDDVKRFLTENSIPHLIFEDSHEADSEWYVNHVYRAYNFGVSMAQSELVLLVNSDMAFDDSFLPNLMEKHEPNQFTTGQLIEPGVLRSGVPVEERYFGLNPMSFLRNPFRKFSKTFAEQQPDDLISGGLYMPLLANRETFLSLGGFPGGNIRERDLLEYLDKGLISTFATPKDRLVPGDAAFFCRAQRFGVSHKTNTRAITYHFQAGERRTSAYSRSRSGLAIVNDYVDGVNGERVFWRDLGVRLEKLGIRVEYIYLNHAISPFRFCIFARRSLRRMSVKPRVLLSNSSYAFPLPSSYRKVVIRQDLPATRFLRLLQVIVRRTSDLVVSNDARFVSEITGEIREWKPLPLSDVWDSPAPASSATGPAIFVGAFNETKGWEEVRNLVLSKVNIQWTLVSKYDSDSHGLPSDVGPNWSVVRQCTQEHLRDLFDNSSVFVLGSQYETQCLAALEAASRNTPVVMHETGLLGNLGPEARKLVGEFGPDLSECLDRAVEGIKKNRYRPREVVESLGLIGESKYDEWIELMTRELHSSFYEDSKQSFVESVSVLLPLMRVLWSVRKLSRRGIEHLRNIQRTIRRRRRVEKSLAHSRD